MKFEIVRRNWISKAITVIIYLIFALLIVIFTFPVFRHYSDISFKIILGMIFVSALGRFLLKPYVVVGFFELEDNEFKILTDGVISEIRFSEITKMSVSLASYYGMPVGLSFQTHHGTDNMVEIVTRQSKLSFEIKLSTVTEMNSIESKLRRLDSQISNLSITRNLLST